MPLAQTARRRAQRRCSNGRLHAPPATTSFRAASGTTISRKCSLSPCRCCYWVHPLVIRIASQLCEPGMRSVAVSTLGFVGSETRWRSCELSAEKLPRSCCASTACNPAHSLWRSWKRTRNPFRTKTTSLHPAARTAAASPMRRPQVMAAQTKRRAAIAMKWQRQSRSCQQRQQRRWPLVSRLKRRGGRSQQHWRLDGARAQMHQRSPSPADR